MRKAQKGDTVLVEFTGHFDDGTKFATTMGEEPLELTIGDGKLIKCFEQSIIGMTENEEKTIRLEAENAMGERRSDLVLNVSRDRIVEDNESLKAGSRAHVMDKNGEPVKVEITKIEGDDVTIDANHPLAGEALTFDIKIVDFV
jgi:FKBP-type peptidyl-prolyl cis-trans isomerase 2